MVDGKMRTIKKPNSRGRNGNGVYSVLMVLLKYLFIT